MLHPIITWGWRLLWTLISILTMLAVMQAGEKPNWVVILVAILSWAIFMLMPNIYNKLYVWVTTVDGQVRFRRVLTLSLFGFLVVLVFVSLIFGGPVWLGLVIAVIITGFWILTEKP